MKKNRLTYSTNLMETDNFKMTTDVIMTLCTLASFYVERMNVLELPILQHFSVHEKFRGSILFS